MTIEENIQGKSKQKTILIVVSLIIGVCLCIFTLCLGGYFLFGDQIRDWMPIGDKQGLTLYTNLNDGSVSGNYQYYNVAGGYKLFYTVSEDGKASFNLDGDSSPGILTIDLADELNASLTWEGVTMDGIGELSADERAAFDELMDSDLVHGLKYIPLDAACQGKDDLSPQQIASLLFPLQMRFKYQITNRQEEAQHIAALSKCDYMISEEYSAQDSSLIQLSPSSPVPVVIGYFPFDAEGAVESIFSLSQSAKSACLPEESLFSEIQGITQPDIFKPGDGVDKVGECGALCRGACGADCDLDNCKLTIDHRCELDEDGNNTGYTYHALIYDCGMHRGCINHDDCYDVCNRVNGCNSWSAAICRHSILPGGADLKAGFCDQTAIWEEGPLDPALWAYGFGYMSDRKTFIYRDRNWADDGYKFNPDACPLDQGAGPSQPDEDKQDVPEKEPGDDEKAPAPDPKQLDPCDFMPPGGSIGSRSEYSCFATYSDKPAERTVQIGIFPVANIETLCQSLVTSDYTVVMNKNNLGDCGFQVEQGYMGTPRGAPGYEGWGIQFGLEGFSVSVMTYLNYPANETWIHLTAEEVEETIKIFLDQ